MEVHQEAEPLYRDGLPVHCLPVYGQLQHARLEAQSDLRAPVPRATFLALSSNALAAAGVATDGLGSIASAAAGPSSSSAGARPVRR